MILGLERGNLDRLQSGDPILFDMAELGLTGSCLIMFGETQPDIMRNIEEAGFQMGGHA